MPRELPLLFGDRPDRVVHRALDATDDIDQDVHPAPPLDGRSDDLTGLGPAGHVADHRDDVPAGGTDLFLGRSGAISQPVVEDDVGALLGQPDGDGPAHRPARTGDHRLLPVHSSHRCLLRRRPVTPRRFGRIDHDRQYIFPEV
jgi:hypothetical protein